MELTLEEFLQAIAKMQEVPAHAPPQILVHRWDLWGLAGLVVGLGREGGELNARAMDRLRIAVRLYGRSMRTHREDLPTSSRFLRAAAERYYDQALAADPKLQRMLDGQEVVEVFGVRCVPCVPQ